MRKINLYAGFAHAAAAVALYAAISGISHIAGFSDWLIEVRCGFMLDPTHDSLREYLTCERNITGQRVVGILFIAVVGATLGERILGRVLGKKLNDADE